MKNLFKKVPQALPALITALILLVSFLAVSSMDSLETKHALRKDFSFNSVTTQSAQTEKVLKELPYPVQAIALFTPGMEDQALLGLLNRLAALSPNFTYTVTSLVKDPLLVEQLSSALEDEQVSADSLILTCEHTGRTRVLNTYDYLQQSFNADAQAYELAGVSYEKSIAEALLYLTLNRVPGIKILTGHGEVGENETAYMESYLKSHHFQTGRINLLQGDALSPDDLLMILAPQKDLLASELAILNDFLNKGGNVLATTDYSDPDVLPNFDALYRLMGFERKAGIVVAEGADVNAYIDNPLFLTPYMKMTEPTAELIGAGQTRLRLPGARALGITASQDNAMVDPLLTSGQAYLKKPEDAAVSLAYEEGEEQGQFNLGLLSHYALPDGTRAKAVLLGNTAILLDSWLHEVTYGAQFLLHLTNYLSASQPINLDIAPKPLVREQLAIPRPGLVNLALIMIPIIVIALAFLVLGIRKRRH